MIKNKKGFTLIELLIVIAIITILASAAVVGLNPAERFKSARNATRWGHMNSIATGIYSYAADNDGMIPTCIPTSPATDTASVCAVELVPDYMSAIPDPPLANDVPAEEYVIEETIQGPIRISSNKAEAAGVEILQ